MSSSYETCTKEKVISYEQRLFIKTALRRIGINSNNNGFILFQKAIIYGRIFIAGFGELDQASGCVDQGKHQLVA